jgi:hypothetical protein
MRSFFNFGSKKGSMFLQRKETIKNIRKSLDINLLKKILMKRILLDTRRMEIKK